MTKVITITSGHMGVGKTSIAVNLALRLSQRGKKVCLFDALRGLDVVNGLLGVQPDGSLKEYVGSRRSLSDMLVKNYYGIDMLPDSPAMEQLVGFDVTPPVSEGPLFKSADHYDYFLVDAPAGLSRTGLTFCLASAEVIVVITPEPESLSSAYSLIKTLQTNGFKGELAAVVNRCENIDDGRQAYSALQATAASEFNVEIPLLGLVYEDTELTKSAEDHQAVTLSKPESVASRCIRNVAKRIVEDRPRLSADEDMQSFWNRLLLFMSQPLMLPEADGEVETVATRARQHSTKPAPATRLHADRVNKDSQLQSTIVSENQMISTLNEWLAKARDWQVRHPGSFGVRSMASRIARDVSGTQTMAKLLRKYPYKKEHVGYRKKKMDVYYVEREGLPPLACAFHGQAEAEGRHGKRRQLHQVKNQRLKR